MLARARIFCLCLAFAGLVLVNACSPPTESAAKKPTASAQPATATPPVKLRMLVLPYTSFAPLLIALEEGYFAEQGLEVESITADLGARSLPLLARGEIDVYGGSVATGMLNLIARGERIRVVADKGHVGENETYFIIVARQDLAESGILNEPGGLRGRRFTGSLGTTLQYYAETLCATGGVAADEIQYTYLEQPLLVEAFRSKAIDLAVTAEPWATRLRAAGVAVPWHAASSLLPGLQYSMVAFGPSLLDKNPEAGRRFMVAYLKGVRRYNEGKTEANLAVLAKHTQLDRELLKAVGWPQVRDDGAIDTDSLRGYQQWALQRKLMDRLVAVDEYWDPSFINYANQVLGRPQQ